MKKLILLIGITLFASAVCFSEIEHDYRYFEVTVDADLDVDQNITSLKEVLVKDLVFNLTDIVNGMGSEGFVVNADGDGKLSINSKIGKKTRMGFFFNVDVSARLGLSKDLFVFLAEGNTPDEEMNADLNVGAQAYAELGFYVKSKIRKFTYKITPSYFLPVLYIPNPDAYIKVLAESDGTMTASAIADFEMYSSLDLSKVFDKSLNFLGVNDIFNSFMGNEIWQTLSQGGFDLDIKVEYPIFRTLDLGLYTHIPIVPARLNYSMSGSASFEALVDPILDSFVDSGSVSPTINGPTYSDIVFGTDTYKVNRPLRIGVEGAWKPFGNWCTFFPSLGLAADNPFGEDFDGVYPEYNLTVDMRLAYILGLNLTTAYERQVFIQKLGIVFNARVFELDVNIASASGSFAKSWLVGGIKANVGIRLGF